MPVYHGNLDILTPSVVRLRRELERWKPPYAVTIVISVNGRSQERIGRAARELAQTHPGVRVVRTRNSGKGWGVFHAWQRSRADWVGYMDVDLATDLADLLALLRCLEDGAEFAVGSRYLQGARMQRTLKRLVLSRIYHSLLIQRFLGVRLSDVQCGFKACRRETVLPIIPRVRDRRWFFEAEMLFIAYHEGRTIHQIPVTWRESAKSSLHIVRASCEFLLGVLRLKLSILRPRGGRA